MARRHRFACFAIVVTLLLLTAATPAKRLTGWTTDLIAARLDALQTGRHVLLLFTAYDHDQPDDAAREKRFWERHGAPGFVAAVDARLVLVHLPCREGPGVTEKAARENAKLARELRVFTSNIPWAVLTTVGGRTLDKLMADEFQAEDLLRRLP